MAFDFSNFKSSLFTTKAKEEEKITSPETTPIDEPVSYQRYGFRQAGSMNGSIEGLKICLNRVYQEHMADMRRNEAKQEELRKPFKEKLSELNAEKENVKNLIKTIENETIPTKKQKIQELKNDIAEIRKHPEHYIGNNVSKIGMYVGGFILALLSIYLFVFYSSASYSALFKNFNVTDAQGDSGLLVKAIFDSKAISNALNDGVTELILILTIPSVFLGLGYLMHKFQESKGIAKYFKIVALLLVTFIFDCILAFEITKKIYDVNAGNKFVIMPEYNLKMAFNSVNFWLIIFAGFIVYLVWGFVFDFLMETYSKFDVLAINIEDKNNKIVNVENDINSEQRKLGELKNSADKTDNDISKIKEIINGVIVQPKEVKEALSQFMVGWYNWLSHGREYNRSEHNKTYEDFLNNNVTIIESVINPN